MSFYLPIADIQINLLLILFFGFIVGFMSGLFGVGGGFLMTPLLIFMGIPPATAVGTESVQILGSSVSGAMAHGLKKKNHCVSEAKSQKDIFQTILMDCKEHQVLMI